MHEMKTCAVKGWFPGGGMCGKIIVGGKFCGHDGPCEHQRVEQCEADDTIKPVARVSKDGGDYVAKCPHCRKVIGLEGDDLSQLRGEQFQHKACGGWLEVVHSARFVATL